MSTECQKIVPIVRKYPNYRHIHGADGVCRPNTSRADVKGPRVEEPTSRLEGRRVHKNEEVEGDLPLVFAKARFGFLLPQNCSNCTFLGKLCQSVRCCVGKLCQSVRCCVGKLCHCRGLNELHLMLLLPFFL